MKNRKKRMVFCLAVMGIMAAVLFHIGQRKEETVLELGMFSSSNWEVASAENYILIDKAIARFEEEHPGVKVKYESGIRKVDYSEWLSQKALKGDMPDVFMILAEDFHQFAAMGCMKDLSELMSREEGFSSDIYYDVTLKAGEYHGVQYALPFETVPTLMFVNKTLLRQEGYEVPDNSWTWSDLMAISEAVTKDLDGDGVIDQFGTYNYSWKDAVYANHGEIFREDGERSDFTSAPVSGAVKYVKRLYDLNEGRKVTQDDFDAGKVAFMPLPFSEYRTYKTYPYKIKKYTSFQWDCITMPAGTYGGNDSEVNTLCMGISKETKESKLAWEFLKLLTADEEVQMDIFSHSQGASVLKAVTGSREAERVLRVDAEDKEKIIDSEVLSEIINNGAATPNFAKYNEMLTVADSEINRIFEESKEVDASLKVLQRKINKLLKK